MTSGRLDFDHELLPQDAEDSLYLTGRGSVFRVEHVPDRPFIRTGECRKLGTREAALPESQRQCGFGRHAGWHRNPTLARLGRAWHRDVVTALDPACDRLLQSIGRFDERFGFIGAGGEAFRQVAERDDDLSRAIGLMPTTGLCRICVPTL